jgi:hypothetical protein
VRFEVFMAMNIHAVLFWVVTPHNTAYGCKPFSKTMKTSYKTTNCHNPEDQNLNSYAFKSTTGMKLSNIRNAL